jgi:hypothetical protein
MSIKQKHQRLACLGITRAMRTAPNGAIEVLLGLRPLHLKIEAEARAGIYSLSCNEQRKPKPLWYRHTSKSRDMMREPILQMGTDKMTPRYKLTPWSRVLLEKLRVNAQLVKIFPAFYGNGSLLRSQEPATCPYPEPNESNPHPQTLFPLDPS